MRNVYTNDEINFLKFNYPNLGAKFCAEKLNRPINSIISKCSELKIKNSLEFRIKNSKLKTGKKSFEKYNVNPVQFITPSNNIVVYILGLLWADGYVSSPYNVSLSTTYPDANYFIDLFLKTGKWKHYDKEHICHPTWKKSCEIKTSNRILTEFLVLNDYKSKSIESADKILSLIPDNLKHYWIRGLFDGDGHIYTNINGSHRISFSSSYNQNWNYLENICKSINIEYKIRQEIREISNNSNSTFTIYGKHKTIKFCEFMYNGYPNDDVGLKRKYEKFLQLKSTEEKNRYKGICEMESGKWRTYTSGAKGNKPKSLGVYKNKEDALKAVEQYYKNNHKPFMI